MSTPRDPTGSGASYNTVDTSGAATSPSAAPTTANFLKWAGAFGVYALVMLALDENDSYSSVVTALGWLVASAAVFKWYKQIGLNLSSLTGVKL